MKTRITVISGFLGSGKTTLLKRFLDREFSLGNKPQVIMSEFGDFDIDGQIIADERLQVSAVTGGCICCTTRDELADAVRTLVKTSPGAPLYIETTGVADPAGVLQTITPLAHALDADISPVLVVYDASQHRQEGRDSLLIEKQLMTADWIILNKADRVKEKLEIIKAEISQVNPHAVVVPAVHADIDLVATTTGMTATHSGITADETADDLYRSFAFKLEARLDRGAFERWLATLPESVVRLKGFVRFAGENGIFEVQLSRGQSSITLFQTDRWMEATLVAITHPMKADSLVKKLSACIVRDGKK